MSVVLLQIDFDVAFGRVDADAHHLAAGFVIAPVRMSRTAPSCSRPTQVWQMPMRQPKASLAPASSPPTRIDTPGPHSASQSDTRKCTVPPAPSPPPLPIDRLESLGVQVIGALGLLEVPPRPRRSASAGRTGTPRARASPGSARRGRPGRSACRRRCAPRSAGSPSCRSARRRSSGPKMTSSALRALCTCTAVSVSSSAPRRCSSRSIAWIGVTPLPAEMNSIRFGSGSGSMNSPSISPRKTLRPGRTSRVKTGDMRPPSVCLTVMLTTPSAWSGSDVIVYARQCRMPLISMPMRRYWPGTCGFHAKSGFTTMVAAPSASLWTRMTSPVSLARRPARPDEGEVVVGQQRGGERAAHPRDGAADPGHLGLGAGLDHRSPPAGRRNYFSAQLCTEPDHTRPALRRINPGGIRSRDAVSANGSSHGQREVRLRLRRGLEGHEGPARRQGRQPRRDDEPEAAGAAGVHHHHRGVPGLPAQRARAGGARRGDHRAPRRRSSARWARSSGSPTTRCSSRSAPGPSTRCPG